MGTDKLILLMYRSWADIDRAVEGLTADEATARYEGGSSIAWTFGHLACMIDLDQLEVPGFIAPPGNQQAGFSLGRQRRG